MMPRDSAARPVARQGPTPKGRRRRACDSCFRKKIQCDTTFPQCNWCKHHNLACTYNRLAQRACQREPSNVCSSQQLSELNLILGKEIGHTQRASPTGNRSPTVPSSPFQFTGHGQISMPHFNVLLLSSDEGRQWVESRTGEEVNFERLRAIELPWANSSRRFVESSGNILIPPLPSRLTIDKCVIRYSSSFQSLVFPVISKTLFKETLDLAYGHDIATKSAQSCVYSLLSVVTLFALDDDLHESLDCGSYAGAAQSFLPQIIQEQTLDGLQSLILQVQLQYFLGDLQTAMISLSIATSLLYKLGAHSWTANCSGDHSRSYNKSTLECHLRDLFWLCYSFDKDISLRTGQPPSINDTDWDLSLSLNYPQWQNADIQRDNIEINDHTLPLFPWDLRLSKIKSQIYQTLYSASARQKSDSEILQGIRKLDQTLEQWRVSLPPDFRPTLIFSQEMPVSANLNTQAVMLRLAYYYCVNVIHYASDRGRLSMNFDQGGLERVNSSISLTITSSCSTLSYLQTALPVVKGECFWIVLFYAITAILTLFCYILDNPLDPDVLRYLDMLHDVPGLIKRIPVRNLTLAEIIHLRFLDGFTAELSRLCTCAISYAQRNRMISTSH